MASGKAILASKACGASIDLVQEGKNGYCFDPFKQNDLVQKITLLAQKKEHLAALGKYSKQIIEPWSFTKFCEVVEALMHN
jgi:glycosyltransferase involved in cell wall biosynthesis